MQDEQLKVFESNDLIRKSGSKLTLLEQKALRYLISKISPYDKPDQVFTVSVADVCEACGLNTKDGGVYISMVKDIIRNGLTQTQGWINTGVSIRQFAWLRNEVEICNDGTMKYQYTSIVQEHLFELKERFTGYQLLNVMNLQSKYAIRLFEILKSYESLGACELLIDNLKKELGATYRENENSEWIEKYPNFYDFEKRVLIPAQNEINLVCRDFTFSYKVGRRVNRKAHTLVFTIRPRDPKSDETKKATEERLKRNTRKNAQNAPNFNSMN